MGFTIDTQFIEDMKRYVPFLFLIRFGMIAVLLSLTACTRCEWFLVNSDIMARYNQTSREWQIIWNGSIVHKGFSPDSLPVRIKPDSVMHPVQFR